jgi:hypothetical protein
MFVETSGVSMTDGGNPVTVMSSPGDPMYASARAVWESLSVDFADADCIPENDTVIKYSPGGNAEKLYAPVSPLIVERDPCNSGEVTVTVAAGNGSPESLNLTTPASEAVVWPHIVAETKKKTHASSVAHERFVILASRSGRSILPERSR